MLAVSLHAVRDDLRNELVPLNRKYPIAELLEACRNYPGVSNAKRITFEYVMLKGVNDSIDDAKALVRLLKGIPAKINLIPFNPVAGHANTSARTGSRSRNFRRLCSTPAMLRRCARRAGAISWPPAASSRARPKNFRRANAWRCAPWRWWSDGAVYWGQYSNMALFGRIIVIVFGLLVAIIVAGITLAIGIVLPEWAAIDSDPIERVIFFSWPFFATSLVVVFALLPAALVIAISEVLRMRSFIYYGVGGALVALASYYRLRHFGPAGKHYRCACRSAMPCNWRPPPGFFGGLAYWLIAGRNAGRWRERRVPSA